MSLATPAISGFVWALELGHPVASTAITYQAAWPSLAPNVESLLLGWH